MAKVISGMSMSLDGYVTGPDDSREHPLGVGGEPLHAWLAPARPRQDRRSWPARRWPASARS